MIARIEGGGVSGQAGALRLVTLGADRARPRAPREPQERGIPLAGRAREGAGHGLKARKAPQYSSARRHLRATRDRPRPRPDVREREVRLDLEVLLDEHVHRPRRVGVAAAPALQQHGIPSASEPGSDDLALERRRDRAQADEVDISESCHRSGCEAGSARGLTRRLSSSLRPSMRGCSARDGIRGAYGRDLTIELTRALGRWRSARSVVSTIRSPTLPIGRDTRLSGKPPRTHSSRGSVDEGGDVVLGGAVPTPAVAFLVPGLGIESGS